MSDPLQWSATLLESFYNHGVRHAIISPGSRSTPLTLAAAIHPGLEKKVILDERSAAFVALGIGKSTGLPALLICTSGTAVANYMPAVVEAKESGVPMVLLTADRPPNLRNLGSSQTVDQIKLFGDQTVFYHEAGEPMDSEQDRKRLSYLAKQAIDTARDPGGAVQINLPFRKPLEPTTEILQGVKERLEKTYHDSSNLTPVQSSEIRLSDEVESLLSESEKPLLVAGPADPEHALISQIEDIASHLHAPVLAEPGSQLSGSDHQIHRFDPFIRNPANRKKLEPDLILRFGDQPFSSSLLWALEAWDRVPVLHISSRRATQDHAMSVLYKVFCRKQDFIDLQQIPKKYSSEWFNQWASLDKQSSEKLGTALQKEKSLTDGSVFHFLSNQLSTDWNVMLSNSLPARDMLTFGRSRQYQYVNRGAAGIDGVLSTALGIHFSSDRPTCCFIGDLAFLHDSNALYTLRQVEDHPFVAIVINNRGGNIFQMLPIHRKEDRALPEELYQTYFQTPQSTDLSYLAKASGIPYQKVESLEDLKKVNITNLKRSLILECVTDSRASMDLRIDLLKS